VKVHHLSKGQVATILTYSGGKFVRTRSRRRRLLFYAFLALSILVIAVVVAREVNVNTVRFSIRPQLSVLILGTPFTVPSGVGINGSLWRDHTLDGYGVSGHSPLTTRDTSGIIFLDSNTIRNFTLMEFLAVWGQTLDNSQVIGNPVPPGDSACMTVNGQTLPTVQDVLLSDNERIELEIVMGNECVATS
jgi:hypothetical protein